MSGLTCGTTDSSLFDCSSTTPIGSVETTTSCTHADDASVRCQGLETGNSMTLCNNVGEKKKLKNELNKNRTHYSYYQVA